MCLSSDVHQLWDSARFAFKPIELSQDRRSLKVQFWWLPPSDHSKKYLFNPPDAPPYLDSDGEGTRLFDCKHAVSPCVKSGDIFTFTTDDPVRLPLPSFELLRVQWFLNRLIALSGAADVAEDELDEDDGMTLAQPIPVGYDVEEDLAMENLRGYAAESIEEEGSKDEEQAAMTTARSSETPSQRGRTDLLLKPSRKGWRVLSSTARWC